MDETWGDPETLSGESATFVRSSAAISEKVTITSKKSNLLLRDLRVAGVAIPFTVSIQVFRVVLYALDPLHNSPVQSIANSQQVKAKMSCNFTSRLDLLPFERDPNANLESLVAGCYDVCLLVYGTGNPDLAGIGVGDLRLPNHVDKR